MARSRSASDELPCEAATAPAAAGRATADAASTSMVRQRFIRPFFSLLVMTSRRSCGDRVPRSVGTVGLDGALEMDGYPSDPGDGLGLGEGARHLSSAIWRSRSGWVASA
jgi:hypothetical protein